MNRLLVKRKAYSYTRNRTRVKVPATTFTIKDRGAPGRGRQVFPMLKKGSLNVNFSNTAGTRRRKEIKLAKRIGERRVVGKLRAVQILNKRTNPKVSRKARQDARFIASSFKGKHRVRTGTGLG